MLRDLDEEPVLAASFHLSSQSSEWPPVVGKVRKVSIDMSHGETAPPTGLEAWESILSRFKNDEYILTGMEKAALKQIGSIYDLKRSTNPAADRANFVKAFESIVAKRDSDRVTLPEVKQFVENNVPLLPIPEENQQLPERPERDEPKEMVGPEAISEFLLHIAKHEASTQIESPEVGNETR